MKNILLFVFIISIASWSCTQKNVSIKEPTNKELIRIIPQGNEISTNLMKSLKAELKSAITEGGFENAIEVCKMKAMPVTESIEKNTQDGIKIKRTTFKYRNPENAPDEIESLALEHFQNLISKNEFIPDQYVQKVTKQNVVQFYYFKPLIIENVCLGCHGNPENMDSRILNLISQAYPVDKATGYKEGDFRGLISVIIPE